MRATLNPAVGAGHAREQKGAGIGAFLVPERKVARMAASYSHRVAPNVRFAAISCKLKLDCT